MRKFGLILDYLLEVLLAAVIFLIPVFFAFWYKTYNIFELNKLVLFESLTLILFFLSSLKLIFYPGTWLSVKPGLTPGTGSQRKKLIVVLKNYFLLPSSLIIFLLITIFFSSSSVISFYGSYERQAGFLSYFFYWLFFVLVFINLILPETGIKKIKQQEPGRADISPAVYLEEARTRFQKRLRRLLALAASSAFLVSIYGCLQILNLDFFTWSEPAYLTHRALSSFGQPNLLASFLLLIIPISFWLCFSARRFWPRFYFGLIFLFQLLCLIMTASRGALVALLVSAVIFFIYWLKHSRLLSWQKLLVFASLGLVFVAALLAFNYFSPGRLVSALDFKNGSSAARVNFYTAAVDAISKKPVIGYGLDNAAGVFINYYESDWGIYGDINSSTDKAHNLVLDILLQVGFIGLLLFAVFYYYYFRLGIKNIKMSRDRYLLWALVLGLAAYLISLLFSFSLVAGEVYLWFYLALIAVSDFFNQSGYLLAPLADDNQGASIKVRRARRPLKIVLALLLGILVFWGLEREAQIISRDHDFNNLYISLARQDYGEALSVAEKIRQERTSPNNRDFYNRFWGESLGDIYPRITEEKTRQLAFRELSLVGEALSGNGYENQLVKGKIYNTLGEYELAIKYFNQVVVSAPHWPKIYFLNGQNYYSLENPVAALLNYQLALLNSPLTEDSRLNERHRQAVAYFRYLVYQEMGDIYFSGSQQAQALKYYKLAYQDYPQDFTMLKKIADIYYLQGDLETAIKYNLHGLDRNPNDYHWLEALAVLNFESGNKEQALEYLRQAIILAPTEIRIKNLKEEYLR